MSGGGLSGMFWNPAIAAYAPAGVYGEAHFSGILGHVSMTGDTMGPPLTTGRIMSGQSVHPRRRVTCRRS